MLQLQDLCMIPHSKRRLNQGSFALCWIEGCLDLLSVWSSNPRAGGEQHPLPALLFIWFRCFGRCVYIRAWMRPDC